MSFGMENVKIRNIFLVFYFRQFLVQWFKIEYEKYIFVILYINVVGSFMYVIVCIGLYIFFGVSVVSRYIVDLGKEYWEVVKWIFLYLKGIVNVNIMFDI